MIRWRYKAVMRVWNPELGVVTARAYKVGEKYIVVTDYSSPVGLEHPREAIHRMVRQGPRDVAYGINFVKQAAHVIRKAEVASERVYGRGHE